MDYDFESSKKWLEKSASTSLILLLGIRDLYKNKNKKLSLEPDSNQRPKDNCYFPLQSSALPTELSRVT